MTGIDASSRMRAAARRTEARESRSMGMCFVVVEGEMVWMVLMVGWILGRERPRRRIVEGEPWAREIAVSAPIPPSLGPVIRNVFPLTWEGKSETMVFPSVVAVYFDIAF